MTSSRQAFLAARDFLLRHRDDHDAATAGFYITYVGRADDVFKASDYRASPFELESVLIEHPSVAEAAVVPSPAALRLAVAKAFVVLRSGVAPNAGERGPHECVEVGCP